MSFASFLGFNTGPTAAQIAKQRRMAKKARTEQKEQENALMESIAGLASIEMPEIKYPDVPKVARMPESDQRQDAARRRRLNKRTGGRTGGARSTRLVT